MALQLDVGRLDGGCFPDPLDLPGCEVGQSNAVDQSFVDQELKGLPGLVQVVDGQLSVALLIDRFQGAVPSVDEAPGLMNQQQVQVLQLEVVQGHLGAVHCCMVGHVGWGHFGGHKQVLALQLSRANTVVDDLSNGCFVLIAQCCVDVPITKEESIVKSTFEGVTYKRKTLQT